jgi:hypothetical protein
MNLKSTGTKAKKFNLYGWQHKGALVYLTNANETAVGVGRCGVVSSSRSSQEGKSARSNGW